MYLLWILGNLAHIRQRVNYSECTTECTLWIMWRKRAEGFSNDEVQAHNILTSACSWHSNCWRNSFLKIFCSLSHLETGLTSLNLTPWTLSRHSDGIWWWTQIGKDSLRTWNKKMLNDAGELYRAMKTDFRRSSQSLLHVSNKLSVSHFIYFNKNCGLLILYCKSLLTTERQSSCQ